MTAALAILVAAAALAFANGANDNFKGVATLHGSGRLSYRAALTLATVTTLAGSLAAVTLASGLAQRFSGKGLVPNEVVAAPGFVLAVAAGAGLTVLLATRLGFPVSTTHALTGALVGGGLAVAGLARISFGALAASFALPLLLSPVLSWLLAGALHAGLRRGGAPSSPPAVVCLCGSSESAPRAALAEGGVLDRSLSPALLVDDVEQCDRRGLHRVLALDTARALDGLHVASAGAVSFARGLNDTPKIAGLLLVMRAPAPGLGTALLGAAMAVGGLLAARRVARTMSFGITPMDDRAGLSANLATAGLVIVASPLGLPVSTTHVSCGALFGIGAGTGEARWRTIGSIAAAWIVTAPVAALLAALAAATLNHVR